jgi:hypothetical protein
MPSVVGPGSSSYLTGLYLGALEKELLCSSFGLLLHGFSSLAAKRCSLESKVTGFGVSPDSLINAHRGAVGSSPRMALACRLRGSWRSSQLPTSLGSHQSSLPYGATAWTYATWTAHSLSGTSPYALVCDRSQANAALACFMHRLWCSINVRCAAVQMPSPHVACPLNCMHPFPTLIFAFSLGWRCFLWPCLRVNSAASVCAVSN